MKGWKKSAEMLERARRTLAAGVSSSFRAQARPLPLYFQSARGCWLTDVDGNRYIDYALAWGPAFLGHGHPDVLRAVSAAMECGQTFGAQHEREFRVSEKICEIVPCAEQVLYASSGTEAVQVALRLARAFTGREKILKFEGHYHGWADNILVSHHPGDSEAGVFEMPAKVLHTAGQPADAAEHLFVLPWNELDLVERLFESHGGEIAAVIMEPILFNSGSILPDSGYLEGVREITRRHGALLIFDEVITGFRVALGGAQEALGVVPDLAVYAKALASGFPLSAVAGRREVFEPINSGRMMHAGSMNGNPIVLAAAEATLDFLRANRDEIYPRLFRFAGTLRAAFRDAAEKAGVPIRDQGYGPAFSVFFRPPSRPMRHYRDTLRADHAFYERFLVEMLRQGVYLLPDARWYLSVAHGQPEVDRTCEVIHSVLKNVTHDIYQCQGHVLLQVGNRFPEDSSAENKGHTDLRISTGVIGSPRPVTRAVSLTVAQRSQVRHTHHAVAPSACVAGSQRALRTANGPVNYRRLSSMAVREVRIVRIIAIRKPRQKLSAGASDGLRVPGPSLSPDT